MNDLAIVGGRIFDGFNSYEANVYVRDGKISSISSERLEAREIHDITGLYLFPGLIDPHVHFSLDLGKYRSADDFESGSKGAAFGGITTFIDFVDPVRTSSELEERFNQRLELARESHVDYALHMTVANPEFPAEELVERTLDLGINSIKCFTTYSSSDRMTEDGYILELLKASKVYGLVVAFHAENDPIIRFRISEKPIPKPSDLPFLHPYESEAEAVSRITALARLTGGQAYVVHNSSGRSIELLYAAGIPSNVRLETCPQYLTLDDSLYLINEESASLHCLVPPLRSGSDVELMKKFFIRGVFTTIGTDHCPFMKNEKLENKEDYNGMPNGIGGVETSFVILHTTLVKSGLISLNDLVRAQSNDVAKTFGLKGKGRIFPGADADFAIFDPEAKWTVTGKELHSKADYTPYEKMDVTGRFVSTVSNGRFVVKNGKFLGEGKGKFLRRGRIFWPSR